MTGLLLAGCLDPDHEASEQQLASTGLSAEYFRSTTFEANQRVLARVDPTIDATYAWGSPAAVVPADGFSVRWTGRIVPRYSQTHRLTVTADDRARVYLDGVLVIDHASWWPSSAQVALTADREHLIRVEYVENWGWAAIKLEWESASQPREVIPTSRLVPAPSPPPQPATGPGGSAYPHGSCVETKRPHAWDDYTYWVYEPASPRPATAPIVVFNHGWMATEPHYYARWLDHLCRRGAIVIYPRYQGLLTLPQFFTPNAIVAVKDALAWLAATPGRVRPRVSDGMAILGHSAGGTVSAAMAGAAAANGLPTPRAVFPVEPAAPTAVPYTDLATIPAATRIACWVGDDDNVTGRLGCDAVFAGTAHVSGKRYWWQFSDLHGSPTLVADHFQPSEAAGYIDTLDTHGAWRIADEMIACAFGGTSCGASTGQGAWSDGTPVRPLLLAIDAVPACPVGSHATGCVATSSASATSPSPRIPDPQ